MPVLLFGPRSPWTKPNWSYYTNIYRHLYGSYRTYLAHVPPKKKFCLEQKPKYMFDGTVIQRDKWVSMDRFYENNMLQSDMWGNS